MVPNPQLTIKDWQIQASVDDDGHLNLFVSHEDGSEILELNHDFGLDDDEWGERFSTKTIEVPYKGT